MRLPTPQSHLYRWHTEALAYVNHHGSLRGFEGGMKGIANDPQPGWYFRRYSRGGSRVPASIRLVQVISPDTGELLQDECLLCEVGGVIRDVLEEWSWLLSNPISEEEYMELLASRFGQPVTPVKETKEVVVPEKNTLFPPY